MLLAFAGAYFSFGLSRRFAGLRGLETSDSEGALSEDASRAVLDAKIAGLIETALVVGVVGELLAPAATLVLILELTILTFTAALVYLTAIYTAAALRHHTERSIRENRAANQAGSLAVVEAVRTLRESSEATGRLIVAEVATLRGAVEDVDNRRRARESELAEAAATQAERDRLAVRPELDARLEIVGGPLHSVLLSIVNSGMDAFNLTVRIDGRRSPNPAIPIGRIGHEETKRINLGDVGVFPWDSVVNVIVHCSAFDVAGRPLEKSWTFRYLRSTGLFGVTTGWSIRRAD